MEINLTHKRLLKKWKRRYKIEGYSTGGKKEKHSHLIFRIWITWKQIYVSVDMSTYKRINPKLLDKLKGRIKDVILFLTIYSVKFTIKMKWISFHNIDHITM